jgi:hypothetical protein
MCIDIAKSEELWKVLLQTAKIFDFLPSFGKIPAIGKIEQKK